MDILLLGRKKDVYSKKLNFFFKRKNHNVDVIWSKDHSDLLKKKINKNYDLLISFRSYFILKKTYKSGKNGSYKFSSWSTKIQRDLDALTKHFLIKRKCMAPQSQL